MRCKTCKKELWASLDNPVCRPCELSRENLERWERLLKPRRDKATPFNLYPEMALDFNSSRGFAQIDLADPEALAYQTPCDQETIVSRKYERRIIIHDGNSRSFWGTFDIEYDNNKIVAMDEHPLQRFINDDVQLSLPIDSKHISMRYADGLDIKDAVENLEIYPPYKGKVKAIYWVYIILVGNDKRYIHYKLGTIWLKNKA